MREEKIAVCLGNLVQLLVENNCINPLTFNVFSADLFVVDASLLTIHFPWAVSMHMNPEEMTLYVLFLQHPSGIRKNDLWEYYTELLELYRGFARSTDKDWTETVIDNICDTDKNNLFLFRLSHLRCRMQKEHGELFASRFAISRNDRGVYRITALIG